MRHFLLALAMSIAGPGAAAAADTPQAQPLASGGKIAQAKLRGLPLGNVVASPAIMQTRAVVNADGSVGVVCEQKPNPHPRPIAINKPSPEPQQ
jgi:hypothetical protein